MTLFRATGNLRVRLPREGMVRDGEDVTMRVVIVVLVTEMTDEVQAGSPFIRGAWIRADAASGELM